MATKCEECGRMNPRKYERGPFIGSPQELDYCKHCSMDLCDDCFRHSCEESVTLVHEHSDEEYDDGSENLSEYPDEAIMLHDPEDEDGTD